MQNTTNTSAGTDTGRLGTTDNVRRTIEAIWHIEAAKVIGRAARLVRQVGLAEEFAQDALLSALETWPRDGIPDNPGAWLMRATERRALDHLRHSRLTANKADEIGAAIDFQHEVASDTHAEIIDARLDDTIGDDLLRLIFTACHPILSPDARSALTLRVMGGLTTDEIARAYLRPEPTIAQRIVRAKRTLAAAKVSFEVPRGEELGRRLASVLEVIYLMFNEGYTATAGNDWMRPALCEEALRLGRVVAGLMPDESEVWGLVALMELQASRFAARISPQGEPVLLLDQNRKRWDHLLVRRGLDALSRAESLPRREGYLGPYALQASIAACHSRAASVEQTDWVQIVALYDALDTVVPSPVVRLNRAVAVSMAYGPAPALAAVDALMREPALQSYHLLPSVRGELLFRLQRADEAREEFERAAALAANTREKALLLARAARCNAV
ncbi:RNA polymerase sigma factor [Propionivibrio soli]|uniref:RNA polymerase sigma factor n=1 Tax=Propionivibrio soli TaxID=2976531 RepID=UPI0021E7BB82|nr:RNA polymerase sigma factor [Propionivibrio soli]